MKITHAMTFTAQQNSFMREAIRLSEENVRSSNGGPFGVVIVKDGVIISTGVNEVTRHNDPTAHAEINAIRAACRVLGTFSLEGCEIYSSCEPCPMCLGAIYWARPSALFFANTQQDAAAIQFDDQFIYQEIARSHADRRLPTYQMLRDEALQAFQLWKDDETKLAY